jgi:hypothetical protein
MKNLVLCLCILAASVCAAQEGRSELNEYICPSGTSFHDCIARHKAVGLWCKANNIKGRLSCEALWVQDQKEKQRQAENEQQAALDKVAMAAYGKYGKPTGLSFTEWEQVQVNAWKADKTHLSFSDWLNSHLPNQ